MESVDREAIVERVREAIDIVDLIGSYVDLRPAGRSYKARCPFHREDTPSFVVSPERQLFHCFGCGVGGDIFSFVMKHDGLAFPEALQLLARRAGITLPSAAPSGGGPDRAALTAALREAVRYYRGRLRAASGAGAARYLQERGLTAEILNRFYVGYAPPSGHALLDHAGKKHSREALVAAGLIGQGEGGRLYDRFRERVVLPVLSLAGEPIGFGARALQKGVEPKYLNSPETPLYKKGRVLFGLPQAREAVRQERCALVVEGYFDVLSLALAGICHAVAPCGTAWTPEHARLLLRYTRRIVFLFDGDSAGRTAAWRALLATLPVHADLGIGVLPGGKDPDDLVREGEVDRLREVISAPLSPISYTLEALSGDRLEGPALMERIAELLAAVGNPVAREMMIDEAAERIRLPARILRRETERLRQGPAGRGPRDGGRGDVRGAEPVHLTAMEEAVLRLVQAQPASAGALRQAAAGAPGIRAPVRAVLAWVEDRTRAGGVVGSPELLRRIEAELEREVSPAFLLDETGPPPDERYRGDLLRRLREQAVEAQLAGLGHEIRTLENHGGGGERLEELLASKQDLARELARLREPAGDVEG